MTTTSQKSKSTSAPAVLRVFVDGSGMRPDGTGSGYAWIQEPTGRNFVRRKDGLTNNVAEYRAVLSAVKHLPEGSTAEIFSDSQLVCNQFDGIWFVKDAGLQWLLNRVREVIGERQLTVKVTWIPREKNLADRLL